MLKTTLLLIKAQPELLKMTDMYSQRRLALVMRVTDN